MVGNNENIYVDFDCDNITLIDPNKVVDSQGKVKERYVKQENLVMYANLECQLIPRTKLIIGATGQNQGEVISVASVNFLKPGGKEKMDNAYTDEITGKESVQGRATNQEKNNGGEKYVSSEGVKGKIVDNGLLGITSIEFSEGLDFMPVISMELVDIQGRSMFELGNSSPYAAFFNLPYPLFYLTIKGYYGKAIKLPLLLQNFSSRYDTGDGNFKISLKFFTYKYTMLSEVNIGHMMAIPHMYKSRLKITTKKGGPSQFSNVEEGYVELGYEKVKELYNEYKSKGLIEEDFPELTLIQLKDKIDNFVKVIMDTYTKQNVNPLNDKETYSYDLTNYRKLIYTGTPSWFRNNLDVDTYLVLKNSKTKVYIYKKEILESEQKKSNAKKELEGVVNEYTEKLLKNNTFGKDGKYGKSKSSSIPNSITPQIFTRSISENEIDYVLTYQQVKKTGKIPSNEELGLFKNELKDRKLLNFTNVTLSNGQVLSKVDYFVFEGDNSFNKYIDEMFKLFNDYSTKIDNDLTESLMALIQTKNNGFGFVPTIRNILAVIFANGEAFLRLMDDVHTKAWDVRDDVSRKNAILTPQSATSGQDNIANGNGTIPVYPWPEYIIQTDGKEGREKYQIEYPGDSRYITSTKAYDYSAWPEVEFLEEFLKGFMQRTEPPQTPTEGQNQLTGINRISVDAIEFPISNSIFSNKEEVKFFYEIYERLFLHANYPLLSRVGDVINQTDKIVDLLADMESNNLLNSLSNDNPFLIKKLKQYGVNSTNFAPLLRHISNGGVGESWQNFIRGIYNTSHIKNITTNAEFTFVDETTIDSPSAKPLLTLKNEGDLTNYLTTNNNDFSLVDLYPFTEIKWVNVNTSNGDKITVNTQTFNTTKTLVFNTTNKVITNFLPTDDKQTKKLFTNFLTLNPTQPNINNRLSLKNYYGFITNKTQLITEGNLQYNNYSGDVSSNQTVSMLNTPYFINAIQDGVKKFREYDNHPFTSAAYLFLNSLPLSTLKEKYVSYNPTNDTELDYIFASLKKFGGIHKVPYAWILKYGSIWYRYKKYVNDNVDILDNIWDDFDYVKNYDPVTSAKTTNYNLNINGGNVDIVLEKNTTIGTDTSTLINTGFYPKLINDFNVFYQGYELFQNYTSTEINKGFASGLTMNYISEAIINKGKGVDPNNGNRDIRIIPWTISVNSQDDLNTYIFPSEGSFINQTEYECFNSANNLTTEVLNNDSIYNGSVRMFWSAPNYGYFDNTRITRPTPQQYIKTINPKSSNQENFSFNGTNAYSDISEILTVFNKEILDMFENEFLNFSKSIYDYDTGAVFTPKENEKSFVNFQMLMLDIMKIQKTTGATTNELITLIQQRQLQTLNAVLNDFIYKDVYFKYGNPSSFNKKLFYTFSQHEIIDGYQWLPYTAASPNALPYNGGSITLLSSQTNYPSEWSTLKTYVGFSEIDGLKYTDNGSYITDFFIDNNVEFNVPNIKTFTPLIKIYATQKLKDNTLNNLKFIQLMEDYLTKNDLFQDKIINSLMIKLQKELPDVNDTPITISTELASGGFIKRDLWSSFKAINDKWIAGADLKTRTLFEDVMFIDRASRDIGNKVIVDIYKLKEAMLITNEVNAKRSMIDLVHGIITSNHFKVMYVPAYVNFYNVQTVMKNAIPKPEASGDFANNMFGTFLNVDTRESSTKMVCMYAGKSSEQLAMDTDLTQRNDDSFELKCGNVLSEDQTNKKDHDKSNKVAGFNIDIGPQNQSMFTSFMVSQDNHTPTAESLQLLTELANNYHNVKGVSQSVSLYNLYKVRSYTCTVSMMGNAMIQPAMYFNLRHVPMYNGPYMITKVTHSIKPGSFETIFEGVRQPTAQLSKQDDFLAVIKTNLLQHIIDKNKQDKIEEEKQTKDEQGNLISQKDKTTDKIDGQKTISTNCTPNKSYEKYPINTTPLEYFVTYKQAKTSILENLPTDDGKLKYVIFAAMFTESNDGARLKAYENNFAGIDLNGYWGASIQTLIYEQFFCLSSNKITLPYAEFKDLSSHVRFLINRWKSRMGDIIVDEKSITQFLIQNISSQQQNPNVYSSLDKTSLENMEKKVKNAITIFNSFN